MSSTATATTNATAMRVERQTYWCHECNISVTLFSPESSSSQTLLCPHCLSDFLEFIPSSSTVTTASSTPLPSTLISNHNSSHSTTTAVTVYSRLTERLNDSTSKISLPASKASVEAIPTVKISSALLEGNPGILCAVCTDEFDVNGEAKQLPCSHLYHSGCILPWLSKNNSCPVCRFQLPAEEISNENCRPRRGVRFSEVLVEEEEWFGFGSILRHIC